MTSASLADFPEYRRTLPGTRILVDNFKLRWRQKEAKDEADPAPDAWPFLFFLSHFHADHYSGLTARWRDGPIYTGEITARLVEQVLEVDPKYIRPLPMGRPVEVDGTEVTLLPANHCPGSAVILFRTRDGRRHLHTGDFRWSREAIGAAFAPLGPPAPSIDCLYLDTTYCHPRFVFPPQDVSVRSVVEKAKEHFEDGRTLLCVATYTIGKEKILLECSRSFGCQVHVSERKMGILGEPSIASYIDLIDLLSSSSRLS
eukprot:tig00021374_g21114.t1